MLEKRRAKLILAAAYIVAVAAVAFAKPAFMDRYNHDPFAKAELRGKCTIILIAHRLSTVQNCDLLFEFGDGRVVASDYRNRLLLVQDALTLHRSDGALVRVTAPVLPGNASTDEVAAFIRALFPILTRHLPE